jgi:hypothetical protein
MACCGQSRAAYNYDEVRTLPEVPARAAPERTGGGDPVAAAAAGTVRLRFTGQARVRVQGPASGAQYVFSGDDPVGAVAAADVDGLVGTGYFRRAY